jgi:hypothetical protein
MPEDELLLCSGCTPFGDFSRAPTSEGTPSCGRSNTTVIVPQGHKAPPSAPAVALSRAGSCVAVLRVGIYFLTKLFTKSW